MGRSAIECYAGQRHCVRDHRIDFDPSLHAHYRDVASAVRSGRRRARHVYEVRDQLAADLFRVDEVRHAEALAPLLLGIVGVDADDNVRAGEPQSLDNIEPDTPEPEHNALRGGSK
jgi:hypothetical protein